jgi:L-alanine-DL-glutamate epimerase-like enolase superfamily enzyme
MKRDSFGEEIRTAVAPDDPYASECPDDLRGSGENQQTSNVLSLASSDESRTRILLGQAQEDLVDIYNPYIRQDLERHYDDPTAAHSAVEIVRYDLLGKGRAAKTERFLRRLVRKPIRDAINSGVIEK